MWEFIMVCIMKCELNLILLALAVLERMLLIYRQMVLRQCSTVAS